jgi:putative FmdB family regulatory protein
MPLYDFRCTRCEYVKEDCYGVRSSDIQEVCPRCGCELVWRPYVNTQSTKTDIKCTYSGKEFKSYGDLERWASKNGKTVVSTSDYEKNHMTKREPKRNEAHAKEVRDEVTRITTKLRAGNDIKLPESVKRQEYRRKHGYGNKE